MKLIDDWRQSWKYFSVHALVIAGAIPPVWAEYPDLKSLIPAGYMGLATVLVALCGLIGRVVDQGRHP